MSKADESPSELGDRACACATARRTARALTRMYDFSLRGSQLEAPQFALLNMLESRGTSSQAAMGRIFALDKTTLSRNLKLLNRKGWVEAAPGKDGRERRFVVTAAGRERLAAARPAWRKAQQRLRSSMSAKEWDAMWRVFRTLTRAAHEAHADLVHKRGKK
jgi:DNA-binding MarR family transcriptional regulator